MERSVCDFTIGILTMKQREPEAYLRAVQSEGEQYDGVNVDIHEYMSVRLNITRLGNPAAH